MKNLILTICLSIVNSAIIFSQEIPTIMPPSPNAAALGQYGEIPVNYYTGVPSISIPLYNIKSGEIKLPITLSYHASGIKIAQEATWVGLGWSLNAGGVITRQVKGLDDFKSGVGYINYQELPQMNPNTYNPNYGDYFHLIDESLEIYEQIEFFHQGSRDAQPDIFNYNFFGYSGKLVFEKQNGTIIKATTIDQNNLDFKYDRNLEKWTVTDEKGWKYFFLTTEISRNSSGNSVIPGEITGDWSEPTITSWYLDKVETPNNDFIDFVYGNGGRFKTPVSYVEQVSHGFNANPNNPGERVNGSPGLVIPDADFGYTDDYSTQGLHQSRYNSFISETQEVVLQRINFKNGYLQFNTVSGSDRIPYASDNRLILNNISVKKLNGKEIKNIWFDTSYFRDDKLNSEDEGLFLRLRLDKVREDYPKSVGGYVSKPPYQFTYNETPLPIKNDILSSDNWGYSNGANNENIFGYDFINFPSGYGNGQYVNKREPTYGQTSIPFYCYLGNQSNNYVKIFMNGADRNTNEDFIKSGILKSIQYPTGAITKFHYEPNDYFKIGEHNLEFETYQVNSDSNINEQEFTLSNGAFVFLQFEFLHPQHENPGYDGFINDMVAVLEKDNGSRIIQFEPEYSDVIDEENQGIHTYEMRSYITVYLEPGSYRIRVQEAPSHYQMSFQLRSKVLRYINTSKKMAGGLRIKKIMNFKNQYDLIPATTKVYSYEENDKSTGKLLSPIQNFYNETDLIANRGMSGSTCCFIGSIVNPQLEVNKIYRSTWSTIPMGSSTQGNIIGYDKVFVSQKDSNGNSLGESIYQFKNYVDETRGTFFPGIPNYAFSENGQLTNEIHKNAQGVIVKTKSNTYYEASSKRINGLVTKRPTARYWNLEGIPDESGEYLFLMARYYDIDMEWWYPSQEVETIYDENGQNPVVTTTNFKYENPLHKLLTERKIITSEGEKITTKYYYPDDITDVGSLPGGDLLQLDYDNINKLKTPDVSNPLALNRISEIIQVETTLNDETSIQRTIYHDENGLVLPKEVQTLKGIYDANDNNRQHRIMYYRYDDNGNPSEVSKNDGPRISYFWGYNKGYPIAKIENATYDDIALALGIGSTALEDFDENDLSSLNDLRILLPKAMVTTYTYDPLIGIKTITDPRNYTLNYFYDEFNRLKEIRDDKDKLIMDYEYHYKNQ